jgi:hypothetical protein
VLVEAALSKISEAVSVTVVLPVDNVVRVLVPSPPPGWRPLQTLIAKMA